MKKVRFESPVKVFGRGMDNLECHSPRPYLEKHEIYRDLPSGYARLLTYNPDPVQRFECSNSSPYPVVNKTSLEVFHSEPRWAPNNNLDLSMLDNSSHEPRKPMFKAPIPIKKDSCYTDISSLIDENACMVPKSTVLSSIENYKITQPPCNSNDNFFIRRENLMDLNSLQRQFKHLSLDKENVFLAKKADGMRLASENIGNKGNNEVMPTTEQTVPDECRCHHCVRIIQNSPSSLLKQITQVDQSSCCKSKTLDRANSHYECLQATQAQSCNCHHCTTLLKCAYKQSNCKNLHHCNSIPKNTVDKRSWSIQRYEHSNNQDICMEVEHQNHIVKEKREPTVSDLFKIIKIQNEQLQLLQEKVDKFISANSSKSVNMPVKNYLTEQLALQTVNTEEHKISIGVMTSFEMVRTSTVINKEIVTQNNENAQIQCNRSQISIKEVISKSQPVNLNFLDGLKSGQNTLSSSKESMNNGDVQKNISNRSPQPEYPNEEKTLNELSLYNVQVDNATTPLISPEQSLYLDVRDYSDSDGGSIDQSNVGWTYYNKVMTHVNGMLQDSDMPSSASALYRNTRQQCVQMQIDKTNVSVAKRVKFGDDPLGIHQPHIYAATTDTSLKMDQLAAKYLKGGLSPSAPQNVLPVAKPSAMPIDMSFATRNYMERHRILQGSAIPPRSPPAGEIPNFLDITALKRQTKLL